VNLIRNLHRYFSDLLQWNKSYISRKKDLYLLKKKYGASFSLPSPSELLAQKYVFVLSTGRCGTGFITNILKQSPDLLVEHNPKPELEYVSSLIHRERADPKFLKFAILAARFDTYFLDSYYRRKIYVETNNRVTFFAKALYDVLPRSKFIHLVRNPADFVRSGMRRGYYQNNNMMHQRLNPKDVNGWKKMTPFAKTCYEWNEINLYIENFKNYCGNKRCMTIKSEDLFSNPINVSLLFDFIGVKNPFSEYSNELIKSKILSKPINRQIVGEFPKYEDWTDDEKSILRKYAELYPNYDYLL
jgi:hypothetical protein